MYVIFSLAMAWLPQRACTLQTFLNLSIDIPRRERGILKHMSLWFLSPLKKRQLIARAFFNTDEERFFGEDDDDEEQPQGPYPEQESNGAMNFMPRMGLVDYDDDDDDDLVKGGATTNLSQTYDLSNLS